MDKLCNSIKKTLSLHYSSWHSQSMRNYPKHLFSDFICTLLTLVRVHLATLENPIVFSVYCGAETASFCFYLHTTDNASPMLYYTFSNLGDLWDQIDQFCIQLFYLPAKTWFLTSSLRCMHYVSSHSILLPCFLICELHIWLRVFSLHDCCIPVVRVPSLLNINHHFICFILIYGIHCIHLWATYLNHFFHFVQNLILIDVPLFVFSVIFILASFPLLYNIC